MLVPVAFLMMGGLPGSFPWQAPALTFGTQLLNAVGALFLVMALSCGKASIVAPTTNVLAPVLTIILSLILFQTLPTLYSAIGIILALVGSTLIVYGDEKRGEVGAEDESAAAAPRSSGLKTVEESGVKPREPSSNEPGAQVHFSLGCAPYPQPDATETWKL